MKNNYTPGQGCQCHAHSEAECGCDVDWTPREVHELREQRDMLAEALRGITDVAERVDGWESFPSKPIEIAREALAAVEGGNDE